ncbi:hypothetical protein LDL59_10755 [Kaistella anthropi]|nr:hypothetical protein [Kaistella anthropi]
MDSRGSGETYGFEILAQKRTLNVFYGIASYTFGQSKFSDINGDLKPSSWDSRHILSLTAGNISIEIGISGQDLDCRADFRKRLMILKEANS